MLKSGKNLEIGDLVKQRKRTKYEYQGVRVPSIYYEEIENLHVEKKLETGLVLSISTQEQTNKLTCSVLWNVDCKNKITNEYMSNLEKLEKTK